MSKHTSASSRIRPTSLKVLSINSTVALCLGLTLLAGCGDSGTAQPTTAPAVTQSDPQAEFEWGMKRLDRILTTTRPSSADGLYTDREFTYQIFPPTTDQEPYTATVSITTEAEFIHGKRNIGSQSEEKSNEKEPNYSKPQVDESTGVERLLKIPGVGPQAPKTTAPPIKARTLENESVFDFVYLDQKWQLKSEPEEDLEKLWFEYAFPN